MRLDLAPTVPRVLNIGFVESTDDKIRARRAIDAV